MSKGIFKYFSGLLIITGITPIPFKKKVTTIGIRIVIIIIPNTLACIISLGMNLGAIEKYKIAATRGIPIG